MYQDTSSPSFSSRNIFLMPKSFRRSRIRHCSFGSENSEKGFRGRQCRFRQAAVVNLASAALAPSSPVPSSYPRAAKSFGWTRASVPSHPISSGELGSARSFPPRPSGKLSMNRCNPAPPKPPGSSVWPSYPQSALRDARHRLECAARALCRRWTPVSHPDALVSSRPNWTKSTLRMEPAVQSAVADIFKSPD